MRPNYLRRAYNEYDKISIRVKINSQKRCRNVINCCIDKRERLIEIDAAFGNIRPPFLKACPDDYHDPTADAGYIARRSNVHWRKFPTYILTREIFSIPSLTSEGFMYILPAYLSYYVQNDFSADIMLIFMEELSRRCQKKELSISEKQAQVIEKVILKPFESYVLRYEKNSGESDIHMGYSHELISQIQNIREYIGCQNVRQSDSEIWYLEPNLPYRFAKCYYMRRLRYLKKRMMNG